MFTNGLPVLYYLDTITLLRIRNISKPMRKRATYIFRHSKTISKIRSSIDALHPWLKIEDHKTYLKQLERNLILKGPDSPKTENQLQVEQIVSKFCDLNEITLIDAISIVWDEDYDKSIRLWNNDSIPSQNKEKPLYQKLQKIDRNSIYEALIKENLVYQIDRFKHDIRLDYYIGKFLDVITIENLDMITFPSHEIPEIIPKLNRIKQVDLVNLECHFHDLTKIHWFKSIRQLVLVSVSIEKEINLPNLKHLKIYDCSKGLSNIKCDNLETLLIDKSETVKSKIAEFKKLKVFKYRGYCFNELIRYLPPSLKELRLKMEIYQYIKTQEVVRQCPYLIIFILCSYEFNLNIEDLIGTNIREATLSNEFSSNRNYPIRFRKMKIDIYNCELIHKHPEIISNCSNIRIECNDFDWKYLPETLKSFDSSNAVKMDEKRFKEYLNKFKNCEVVNLWIEKAEFARELCKIVVKANNITWKHESGELKRDIEGRKYILWKFDKGNKPPWKEYLDKPDKRKKCSIF